MGRVRRWAAAFVRVAPVPVGVVGVVLVLVLGAAPVGAEDAVVESFELDDTEALVTACTVPEDHPLYQTAKGFCLGFMTGAMHFYDAAVASPKVQQFVCPEQVLSRAEMRAVFLEWSAAHPERLSEPAIDGLVRAAVARFPCP